MSKDSKDLAHKPLAVQRSLKAMAENALAQYGVPMAAETRRPLTEATGSKTPQPVHRPRSRLAPLSPMNSTATATAVTLASPSRGDELIANMVRSMQQTASAKTAATGSTKDSGIPSLNNPERAVVSLTGVTDRCRVATKAIHYQVLEQARATVLEARRERSGAELNNIIRTIFPNLDDDPVLVKQRGGRGAPSIAVPTVTLLIDKMMEEKKRLLVKALEEQAWDGPLVAAPLALQEQVKVAFEEHMADQIKWLVQELGVYREGSEVLDERYRLLLLRTADLEEAAFKAEQRRREAEQAKLDALRMLTEEREHNEEIRDAMTRETQHLRQKLFNVLEAQAQGLTAGAVSAAGGGAAANNEMMSPKGRGGTKASPKFGSPSTRGVGSKLSNKDGPTETPPSLGAQRSVSDGPLQGPSVGEGGGGGGGSGVSFEEKEKLLRQLVDLRKETTDAKREASILNDRLEMATADAAKARSLIAGIRRNCDSEIKNYQDLLVSIRNSHEKEAADMDRNYNQLLHQVQVYEASVFELQAKLQDVSARMLSMQNTLMSGPSVQTLLFKTFVKSQDASLAQDEINRMTAAIAEFVERFEAESAEGTLDPDQLFKQAQRRKAREAERQAKAAAEHAKREAEKAAAKNQAVAMVDAPTAPAATTTAAASRSPLISASPAASTATQPPAGLSPVSTDQGSPRRVGATATQSTQTHPASELAAVCRMCRRSMTAEGDSDDDDDGDESEVTASHATSDKATPAASDSSPPSPTPALASHASVRAIATAVDADPPQQLPAARPSVAPKEPAAKDSATHPPAATPQPVNSVTSQPSVAAVGGERSAGPATPQSAALAPPQAVRPQDVKPTAAATPGSEKPRSKKKAVVTTTEAPLASATKAPVAESQPSLPKTVSQAFVSSTPIAAATTPPKTTAPPPPPEPEVVVIQRVAPTVSKEHLDALARASAHDSIAYAESERLREAKDRAEARAREAEEAARVVSRELAASKAELQAVQTRLSETAESLSKTLQEHASEQSYIEKLRQRITVLCNDSSRLESEAHLKEEQHITEVKALHNDIIQLRHENKTLSVSDARAKLRAKEKLFYEGAEKMFRCLLSLQATAACTVCLDKLKDPVVLVPCGHIVCSKCFRSSNLEHGITIVADSDNIAFGPTTCITAGAPLASNSSAGLGVSSQWALNSSTSQQQQQTPALPMVAKIPMTTASRHLHERLRSATYNGSLSSPEQFEAVAHAAIAALGKPARVTAWWCEDCDGHVVDRIMPSPRVVEVVDKATYVLSTATEIRRGVVLAAAAVDGVDPPPSAVPVLRDSSVRQAAETLGADLEADASQFVLE